MHIPGIWFDLRYECVVTPLAIQVQVSGEREPHLTTVEYNNLRQHIKTDSATRNHALSRPIIFVDKFGDPVIKVYQQED